MSELAHRGTTPKVKPLLDLAGCTPEQFRAATGLIGAVERLQRYADKEVDLEIAILGLNARERRELIASTICVRDWLDTLLERLDAAPSHSR